MPVSFTEKARQNRKAALISLANGSISSRIAPVRFASVRRSADVPTINAQVIWLEQAERAAA